MEEKNVKDEKIKLEKKYMSELLDDFKFANFGHYNMIVVFPPTLTF